MVTCAVPSVGERASSWDCLKMTISITWQMEEAIVSNSPASIRTLFAVILAWCEPSNPVDIYDSHKEAIAEDFLHQQRTCTLHRNEHLEVNDDIFNLACRRE